MFKTKVHVVVPMRSVVVGLQHRMLGAVEDADVYEKFIFSLRWVDALLLSRSLAFKSCQDYLRPYCLLERVSSHYIKSKSPVYLIPIA